jgi:hypothetical protein
MLITAAIEIAIKATGRSIDDICICHHFTLKDMEFHQRICEKCGDELSRQFYLKRMNLGNHWDIGFQMYPGPGHQSVLVLENGSVVPSSDA